MPSVLVVKNGFKDVRFRLGVHADAVVREGKQHGILPLWLPKWDVDVRGVEGGVLGLDEELAAVRHRVAGVDGEVEQHLLDLTRIGFDLTERLG